MRRTTVFSPNLQALINEQKQRIAISPDKRTWGDVCDSQKNNESQKDIKSNTKGASR